MDDNKIVLDNYCEEFPPLFAEPLWRPYYKNILFVPTDVWNIILKEINSNTSPSPYKAWKENEIDMISMRMVCRRFKVIVDRFNKEYLKKFFRVSVCKIFNKMTQEVLVKFLSFPRPKYPWTVTYIEYCRNLWEPEITGPRRLKQLLKITTDIETDSKQKTVPTIEKPNGKVLIDVKINTDNTYRKKGVRETDKKLKPKQRKACYKTDPRQKGHQNKKKSKPWKEMRMDRHHLFEDDNDQNQIVEKSSSYLNRFDFDGYYDYETDSDDEVDYQRYIIDNQLFLIDSRNNVYNNYECQIYYGF
jgi:hypothetical protein